jgi:hypothetical protein
MRRFALAAIVGVATAGILCAAPAPDDVGPWFIDLSAHTNVKLTDGFHSNANDGNNLANLPTGKQKFADVKFNVGTGIVQLGSSMLSGKSTKAEGIKVDHAVAKLRFLHSTGWKAAEGQVIAKYVVHYDDKSTADIEIAYGRDVVDWWVTPNDKAPTVSKVAWEGKNDAVKDGETKITLFMTTWENPNPKKKIVSIDFIATMPQGQAAPFCIAMTAEDK